VNLACGLKLRANKRSNSQHCWAKHVGSCCVCVSSDVQTDATNSKQCWDLQCMVGRIQPIILCKPSIMRVRGLNNVGRTVKTDPKLLRYASAITEQKKCWELLAQKFDGFQTLRNNSQQHTTTRNRVCKRTQHVTSNNVEPFARGLTSCLERA